MFGQTVETFGVFNFKSLSQTILHLIKDVPRLKQISFFVILKKKKEEGLCRALIFICEISVFEQ